MPACATVAQLSWVIPIVFQLESRPSPHKGVHLCYHKLGQNPVAEEVPVEKQPICFFLSGCNVSVKLTSKHVFTPIDHCCYQTQLITTGEAPKNN